jgi:DNA-binding transcriptional LysR family regulator
MRNVTLRQLRALSTIGRTHKIASAARELNLTAPAVTLQLQQLEAELGFVLFDRTPEGLRATEAGKIMLDTAAQLWTLLSAGEDRLAALKGIAAGHVAVGVVSTAKYFSPRLIALFSETHPGVEISLRVGNRDEISARLRDFDIDVAIMGTPPPDLEAEKTSFGDHPLVIAAPPDHRLAFQPHISKMELADETFLVREDGSGTRTSMEIYLDGVPRRTSRLRIEMGSNETIKQAVMAGLGIAFISAHTVAAEVADGRLVLLDVEGLPVLRKWFVVRRADKALMPAARVFADFIAREGGGHLPKVHPPSMTSVPRNATAWR